MLTYCSFVMKQHVSYHKVHRWWYISKDTTLVIKYFLFNMTIIYYLFISTTVSLFCCVYYLFTIDIFIIERILRSTEIQKIKVTILLVHGNITFIQCSRWRSICSSRFQVIVELSCHSILVELFVIIKVVYKFTIHMLRYWKVPGQIF